MNKWIQFAALSLVLGAATHPVKAAPAPAPSQPDTITLLQAKAWYGQPDIYLDGKGGNFWLFTLRNGRRLMIEVAPQDKPVKRQVLPWSWQPAPGGHVLKRGERTLTFVPAPPRSAPPRLMLPVPDRYHPGVKLLARAGQE